MQVRFDHDDNIMGIIAGINGALAKYGLEFRDVSTVDDAPQMVYDLVEMNHAEIDSALYGAEGSYTDVTEFVRTFIKDREKSRELGSTTQVPLRVLNSTFKIDPAPGIVKSLRVTYRYKGETKYATVREGEELVLEETK